MVHCETDKFTHSTAGKNQYQIIDIVPETVRLTVSTLMSGGD